MRCPSYVFLEDARRADWSCSQWPTYSPQDLLRWLWAQFPELGGRSRMDVQIHGSYSTISGSTTSMGRVVKPYLRELLPAHMRGTFIAALACKSSQDPQIPATRHAEAPLPPDQRSILPRRPWSTAPATQPRRTPFQAGPAAHRHLLPPVPPSHHHPQPLRRLGNDPLRHVPHLAPLGQSELEPPHQRAGQRHQLRHREPLPDAAARPV